MFIGYPIVRQGEIYDPRALGACLIDPRCPDEEWDEQTGKSGNRNYSRNRNFIGRVTLGSIVIIPRPGSGTAYLGRIDGPFEIVDAPEWGQSYLDLRAEQGLDVDDQKAWHTADVAQGWPVDHFREIDLSRIPGWLRRSLLGRSTYGELPRHPLDKDVTAWSVLDQILNGVRVGRMPWTLEPKEVKRHLVDTLSNPCAFENLVVALLQIEHPDETWHHTGGPGDGGIDGFGCNEAGEIVGLMQAKYYANSAPELGSLSQAGRKIKRYAAVFLPEDPIEPSDGTHLLNLDWIVHAFCRHWRHLPLAVTLRVGEGAG